MNEGSIETNRPDTRELACRVLIAYVRHNAVPADDVPPALRKIHRAFETLTGAAAAPPGSTPAVPIKKSVGRDYIICLEDGRKLKVLTRHLRAKYHMTPKEYRAKWHLPATYPMVAPSYAAKRSALAKKARLGHRVRRS